MATKFVMKQHDLEPAFEVQLLDGVTPIDLTSVVEVKFIMRNRKGIKAVGLMDVADQNMLDSTGIVRYTWTAGDTDLAGTYSAEVQVTWPGGVGGPVAGRTQTFPADQYITVDIQKDLGPALVFLGSVMLIDGGDLNFEGENTTVVTT